MFTVALIGPDGSGKTTVGRRLERSLTLPVKYIYMGINRDASNIMLPTTRLVRMSYRALGMKQKTGPTDPNHVSSPPEGWVRRAGFLLKSNLGRINLICEGWFRQGMAWYYRLRGYIVLFDRHFFFDFYTSDIANGGKRRPFLNRLHSLMLERLHRKPDLVIYLDAPAELLFARKGEGTLEALEHWRHEYRQMGSQFRHFVVVDSNQPEDNVVRDVAAHVWEFYRAWSKTKGRNGKE